MCLEFNVQIIYVYLVRGIFFLLIRVIKLQLQLHVNTNLVLALVFI